MTTRDNSSKTCPRCSGGNLSALLPQRTKGFEGKRGYCSVLEKLPKELGIAFLMELLTFFPPMNLTSNSSPPWLTAR